MINRLIFYSIVAVIISVGLFYVNQDNVKSTSKLTKISNTQESPARSSPATENAISNELYEVKQGDTLFSIGKKYNMLWTVIAKINNLDENSRLIIGQKIVIPTEDQSKTIQTKTDIITADQEELDNLRYAQNYVNAGKDTLSYRRVPIEVVKKSRLLIKYQFSDSDLYIEKNINVGEGSAIVEVTHRGSLYTIYLNAYENNRDINTVWTPVKVTY